MKSDLFVLGAGGHLRSIMNLINSNGYSINGILDEFNDESIDETINGVQVLGNLSEINPDMILVLAYGDNSRRREAYNKFRDQVLGNNLIHKAAIIEKYATLGESNQVFANAYINSNVSIGDNNIINTGAIIEHEVEIGNHSHISIGSIIGGRTTLKDNCFVGAGAVIIDKISVCSDVTIGANSVVIRDITQAGTYVGSPAVKTK